MSAAAPADRSSLERVVRALDAAGSARRLGRELDFLASCPVPSHGKGNGDRHPSLHVTYSATDAKVLLSCKSGCDARDVVDALGLSLADLYDQPLDPTAKPASSRTRRARKTTTAKTVTKPATTAKTPARKPAPSAELGAPQGPEQRTAEYVYVDEAGTALGRVVRFEQAHAGGGRSKRFVQQHVDARGRWVTGQPERKVLYRLPEVRAAVEAGTPVYVCEGEKDADAMTAAGVTATTNAGGAGTWREEYDQQLAGAHVVLVVDRDSAGYLRGLKLSRQLAATTASVRVSMGRGDNDATDHLAAGHQVADLIDLDERTLIGLLVEVDPTKAARATLDRLTAGVTATELLGDNADELLATMAEQSPRDAESLLSFAGAKVTRLPGIRAYDDRVLVHPTYQVIDGKIYELTKRATEDNPEVWKIVLGCTPKLVRVETAFNGDEQVQDPDEVQDTLAYVVRWEKPGPDGQPVSLGAQRVPAKDWFKGEWIQKSPAVAADVALPRNQAERGKAVEALRMTSAGLSTRTAVHTATGWRQDTDGSWYYVHAGEGDGCGRAITATGVREVRTAFRSAVRGVTLPDPDRDQAREAFAEVFHLMAALPGRIASPLVGLVARSAVAWTPSPLMLNGQRGSGKTSIATLIASFFDPTLPWDRPRASLGETASTEKAQLLELNRACDTLILFDDANPDAGMHAAAMKIAKLARHQHGTIDRQVMSITGEGNLSRGKARGTVLLTGEVNAGLASASAQERIFEVPVCKDDIDRRDTLPELHSEERRARRSAALSLLIAWLAPRLEEVRADLAAFTGRQDPRSYTRVFDEAGFGDRTSTPLADYAFGWRIWLLAALDAGAIDTEQATALWGTAMHALLEAGHRSEQATEQAGYDARFQQLISSTLASGLAHMLPAGRTEELPLESCFAVGWKARPGNTRRTGRWTDADVQADETIVEPAGRHIGWVNLERGRAYLLPSPALAVSARLASEMGLRFEPGERTLGDTLANTGRLRQDLEPSTGKRRNAVRITCQGSRQQVWDIDLAWLLDTDNPEDGDAGKGTPLIPPCPTGDSPTSSTPVSELNARDRHPRTPAAAEVAEVEELPMAAGAEHFAAAHAPSPTTTSPQASAAPVEAVTLAEREPCEVCGVVTGVRVNGLQVHAGPCVDVAAARSHGQCVTCGQPTTTRAGGPWAHPGACTEDLRANPPAPTAPQLTLDTSADTAGDTSTSTDPAAARPAADQPGPVESTTTSTPTPAPKRQAPSSGWQAPQWRAPAAVLDVDGIYLPGGEVLDRPKDIAHIGHLAELAHRLELGAGGSNGRRVEAGQIWLTAAMAADLGLPVDLAADNDERNAQLLAASETCAFLTDATAAGWSVGGGGRLNGWMTVWRDGIRSTRVVLTPAVDPSTPPMAGNPTPSELAAALAAYERTVGMSYHVSPRATGTDLLLSLRRKDAERLVRVEPCPPALIGGTEVDPTWTRKLLEADRQLRYVHAYDTGGAHLAAWSSVELGWGPPVHHPQVGAFDKKTPGYWLVDVPKGIDWRLPHPMDAMTRHIEGARWFATPTLAVALELGYDLDIREAWLWPSHGRILEPAYRRVKDARNALEQAMLRDEPGAAEARDLLKATYTRLTGSLASERTANDHNPLRQALHRPDWRHAIVSTARANRLRQIAKIGAAHDIWPVALVTDTVLYLSNDPDPVSAWPGDPAKLGRGLGQYKPEGSALLADHARYFTAGPYRGKDKLIDPEPWAEQIRDGE